MSILITKDTTFIIQGITGREAVSMTRECLDFGSKVVGGVTPGRAGRDVYGVPVFDTVRDAMRHTRVDASVVAVPPAFTRDAVFEALEAGIKLIVVVTERIPRFEVAQMVELAQLKGARIIGPNCLGVLSPGEAKIGGMGGRAEDARKAFTKGPVGVTSRSGGMEAELATYVVEKKSRLPIIAFMAGRFMDEMPGMRFGHAGTIVEGKADTTADKIARLQKAGISVAERIEDIPGLVKQRLGMAA